MLSERQQLLMVSEFGDLSDSFLPSSFSEGNASAQDLPSPVKLAFLFLLWLSADTYQEGGHQGQYKERETAEFSPLRKSIVSLRDIFLDVSLGIQMFMDVFLRVCTHR